MNFLTQLLSLLQDPLARFRTPAEDHPHALGAVPNGGNLILSSFELVPAENQTSLPIGLFQVSCQPRNSLRSDFGPLSDHDKPPSYTSAGGGPASGGERKGGDPLQDLLSRGGNSKTDEVRFLKSGGEGVLLQLLEEPNPQPMLGPDA